jgi:hypothetical protein
MAVVIAERNQLPFVKKEMMHIAGKVPPTKLYRAPSRRPALRSSISPFRHLQLAQPRGFQRDAGYPRLFRSWSGE